MKEINTKRQNLLERIRQMRNNSEKGRTSGKAGSDGRLTNDDMMILSEHTRISENNKMTRRNLNTVLIGGSGSGKTYDFIRPNILKSNMNMIVTDPAGELYDMCHEQLEEKGYNVRVFDCGSSDSIGYNPFHYIHETEDVYLITDTIMANTLDDGAGKCDLFWQNLERQLLNSVIMLLWRYYPEEDQNLITLHNMIGKIYETDPEDPQYDMLTGIFGKMSKMDPGNIASRLYGSFVTAGEREKKEVAASIMIRLQPSRITEIQKITKKDETELEHFDDRKNIFFIRFSEADRTFRFIEALLCVQALNEMCRIGEDRWQNGAGEIAHHTVLFIDESGTGICMPGDFDQKIAVIRKLNMNVVLSAQTIAQIQNIYPGKWKTITGNCDIRVIMGCNDTATAEWLEELIPYEHRIIKSQRFAEQRKAVSAEEFMRLDDGHCIVIVRGNPWVIDKKYTGKKKKRSGIMLPSVKDTPEQYMYNGWKDNGTGTNVEQKPAYYKVKKEKSGFLIFSNVSGKPYFPVVKDTPDKNDTSQISLHNTSVQEKGTKNADGVSCKAEGPKNIVLENGTNEQSAESDSGNKDTDNADARSAVRQYDEKQEEMKKKGIGNYGGSDTKSYTVNEALKIIKIKEERVKALKKQVINGASEYLPLSEAANTVSGDEFEYMHAETSAQKNRYHKTQEIKRKIFQISQENESIADIERQIRHYDAETVPEEMQIWNTTIEQLKDGLPALKDQRELLQTLVSAADSESEVNDGGKVYVKKTLYSIKEMEKDLYALTFKIAFWEECIEESYTTDEPIKIKGEIYI